MAEIKGAIKSADEVIAWFAQARGERAPEYVYEITGIAHRAIEARARRRWLEWNKGETPMPYDDEIPY